MKIFLLIYCTTAFSFNIENSFPQEKVIKVSIDKNQLVSVDEVFKIIKQQTEYCFMYPNGLFKNAPKVQLRKGRITVVKLLKQSLSDINYNFELTKNKNIIIKKKIVINNSKKKKELQKNKIQGFVLDESTGETLPYATIRLLNTRYYTITNEDGKFELSLGEDVVVDSLEVRFMGFITKKVSVSYFKTNEKLYLTPHISAIDVVYITNKKYRKEKNYTYGLLNRLIKKYRKDEIITNSKAFLSLTSSARNIPIEHIEGFYNSKQSLSNGLDDLTIKSGRFGQNKSFPFYSLDNTVILKNFQPFKKNIEQILPLYPGNMSQSSIKSNYIVTVEDCMQCDVEDISILFTPKRIKGRLFSGKIIFDEKKLIIKKIELTIENPETYGLSSVGENDIFTPKKIKLNVVFNPLDFKKIQHLDFVFDIQYNSEGTSEYIKSKSFLYFYDYENTFEEPYFLKKIAFKNDYDKIIALQASETFWNLNYQFPKSYNDIRSMNFMEEYGYLINYDNFIPEDYIKFIKPSVISWSKDNRLSWESIKHVLIKKNEDDDRLREYGKKTGIYSDKQFHSISEMKKNVHQIKERLKFSYVFDIYKDKKGNKKLTSRTIFNRGSSYSKNQRTKNKLVYINLIFDIYEYHRQGIDFQKEFIDQMSSDEIKKIFDDKFLEASEIVKKMKKETSSGTNYQNLLKWNRIIKHRLNIDNYSLISKNN